MPSPADTRLTPADMAEHARMDRVIALLKVAAPDMCGIDLGDLERLAEVFHGYDADEAIAAEVLRA